MKDKTIGFIGLGAMGSRMARNLAQAGYRVIGYDIRPEAAQALVGAGGKAGHSAPDVVRRSDVVLTSLVSHVCLRVAEESLLPNARPGHIFIDHSTIPAPETRRLAEAFAARGAIAIDAPVSGWITGAEQGTLTIFIGGDPATVRACWPIFEVLGDASRLIYYGGPPGSGQVMKVMQQLRDRLLNAARLEIMAFGAREGLGLDQILRVLNVDPAGPDGYAQLARQIQEGQGDALHCLFGEWPYYLREAQTQGIPMPMLESLYQFCRAGERVNQDEQGRPGPSVWRELTARRGLALPPVDVDEEGLH